MKDFIREYPLFSLCGLNCGLCTMYIGGHCPGCGGGDGNQSCSIARCSVEHGVGCPGGSRAHLVDVGLKYKKRSRFKTSVLRW